MKSRLSNTFVCAFFAGTIAGVAFPAHAQYTARSLNYTGYSVATANGIRGERSVGSGVVSGADQALFWADRTASPMNLHPTGFDSSVATSIATTRQGGYGVQTATGASRALLWAGTAASVANLHPTGFDASAITAITDSRQVGYGITAATGAINALFWAGSASSVVNLNGSLTYSLAYGTSGGTQVGAGLGTLTGGNEHALLWNQTAGSVVSLRPVGFSNSVALAAASGRQVGYGFNTATNENNALRWQGTAASVVNLHPAAFLFSQSLATNGTQVAGVVGGSTTGFFENAVVWTSDTQTVNLHDSLTTLGIPNLQSSRATGISETGDIVGFAQDADGNTFPVFWEVTVAVIPELGTATLCSPILLVACILYRKQRLKH